MKKNIREKTEVNVQLFITDFLCSPDEITRILRIKPTKTWLRGDPIHNSTSVGCKVNGWKLESPAKADESPEKQVDALFKVIMRQLARFKELPPECVLSLSCAIYANDNSQRVFEFSEDVVKNLAKIGASIDSAYYCLGKHI